MKNVHAIAAVLALAACSPKQAAQEAAPPPPAAPAPAAAPALAPITATGWGAIKVDMTNAQALAVIGPVKPDPMEHDEDWLACHMIQPVNPDGLWVMVEEDRVTRVSTEKAGGLVSDKGIAIGDPAEKVRAAYPTGLKVEPHKYEDAPAAYLTFWSPGEPKVGVRYSIGHDGKVAAISGGLSIEYVEGCS